MGIYKWPWTHCLKVLDAGAQLGDHLHKYWFLHGFMLRNIDVVQFSLSFWAPLQVLSEKSLSICLGITTDTHLQDVPLFLDLETKRTDGDMDDALLQLYILQLCKRSQSLKLLWEKPPLPNLGFVVHRHSWNSFIAHKGHGQIMRLLILFTVALLLAV